MSLLILPRNRTSSRRLATALAEELHFDAEAVGRAVAAIERAASRAHTMGMSIRSDLARIILRVPEPFRPFAELVYFNARRKPGAGMHFSWVAEKVRFRTRRDVLRFLYCHEWLHWYLREVQGRRAGAETACDRFALRNFRRRRVTVDDAMDALHGTRMQPLPEQFRLA